MGLHGPSSAMPPAPPSPLPSPLPRSFPDLECFNRARADGPAGHPVLGGGCSAPGVPDLVFSLASFSSCLALSTGSCGPGAAPGGSGSGPHKARCRPRAASAPQFQRGAQPDSFMGGPTATVWQPPSSTPEPPPSPPASIPQSAGRAMHTAAGHPKTIPNAGGGKKYTERLAAGRPTG